MSNSGGNESIDHILANVSHLHRTRVMQLLDGLGLYQGQPLLLSQLWKQEGLTQSELAEKLKLSAATVTRMLQRMEKAGFVRREADAQDQRVTRVFPTSAGREVRAKVEEVWATMERETFANLSSENLLLLRNMLMQLRDNLLAVTGEEAWK